MRVCRSETTSRGVIWPSLTSGVKRTSKIIFVWKFISSGFQAWETRIWVWIGLSPLPGGSCDPRSLPGSKEHRHLLLLENSFFVVCTHNGHGYECGSASDHHQRDHVTQPHCRGQKNIKNYFCLETCFQLFSRMKNTNMSVTEPQITLRGSLEPHSTSVAKTTSRISFLRRPFPSGSRTARS